MKKHLWNQRIQQIDARTYWTLIWWHNKWDECVLYFLNNNTCINISNDFWLCFFLPLFFMVIVFIFQLFLIASFLVPASKDYVTLDEMEKKKVRKTKHLNNWILWIRNTHSLMVLFTFVLSSWCCVSHQASFINESNKRWQNIALIYNFSESLLSQRQKKMGFFLSFEITSNGKVK